MKPKTTTPCLDAFNTAVSAEMEKHPQQRRANAVAKVAKIGRIFIARCCSK